MRLINFDMKFQEYMAAWVQENAEKYGNNFDRMEEKMPEVYLQWLNAPADWLEGLTPGTFFAGYDDAMLLVEWMLAYVEGKTPIPDQLLERIADLGEPAEAALLSLLEGERTPEEALLTSISLLTELESKLPMAIYISWITGRPDNDTRADMAAEALSAMGRAVVAPVLLAMDNATRPGKETFLDVLSNFPGDDEILTRMLAAFATEKEKRALYASLLGKLGDERAVPALLEAVQDTELNYLEYIELRNALEALGSDAPQERVFDGDPYYESLRRME